MTASGDDDFRGTTRFDVVRRLGAGGMGVVYEALDRTVNVRVALKTMRNATGDAILRFKHEFRALQDLRHPNLVGLGELIRDSGRWFFTMELVDGRNFLHYVRSSSSNHDAIADHDTLPSMQPVRRFDEQRLRDAFAQLMRGLAALHAAQKVHRDVKPSNVLVHAGGRVVLLDFGLILDRRGDQSTDANIVGTVAYMAPEQAAARPAGPASDCYAAGVMLYEVLTGQLPFAGDAIEVLVKKQSGRPRSPRSIDPGISADLEALCLQLLENDPSKRPSATDVLSRLGARKPSLQLPTVPEDTTFVGRTRELTRMDAAFQAASAGSAVTLFVEGESGIGKTALVRHFIERIGDDAVVLSGRCYERESVPYKALDGVVDALSRYMTRLPEADAAGLLPRNVGVLTQVFPVLSRVNAVLRAPRLGADALDPQELRTRLFAAVRELFARVADRRPLVIVIDDFQWADADSSAMLTEIARGPDAPRILVLGTCRSTPDGLEELRPERLALGGLDPDDACSLAAHLLASDAEQVAPPAAIASEAAGHPLFIDELVRHARRSGDRSKPLQLDQALWARVARLEAAARSLLELLAVAGAPLPQEVVAQAAGMAPAEFARNVAVLRDANLVRTAGLRGSDAIECYHDRVRESVLARLAPEERRQRHEQLARSLAGAEMGADEALMLHWREAGNAEQAARHAARAAEQAERALAFNRAARLYELAIELRPGQDNRPLLEALGGAHANDGRGKQAAEAYLAAAGDETSVGALDLRRRAAEQLLTSGYVKQGIATINSVLEPLGMKTPSTSRGTLSSFLYHRAHVVVRGRKRRPGTPSAEHLLRIDTCLSGGIGLVLVDILRASDFFARALRLAMKGSDDFRFARALAGDCSATTSTGARAYRRGAKLLEATRRVADASGNALASATAVVTEGGSAVCAGLWASGLDSVRTGQSMLRERCVGTHWEINAATLFELIALFSLGRIRELARIGMQCAREAEQRGNLFGQAIGRSNLNNVGWLAEGDVDEARRQADMAIKLWSQWSQSGEQQQNVWDVTARGNIAVYAGIPAWTDLAPNCQRLERSIYFRIELNRVFVLDVLARSALSDAVLHAEGSARRMLLREARRIARRLQREPAAYAQAFGVMIAAQLHALGGRADVAATQLADAARRFDEADMLMHAAVARIRQGQLVGGDAGAQLRAAGGTWMTRERIAEPDRWLAMFSPGFASLHQ